MKTRFQGGYRRYLGSSATSILLAPAVPLFARLTIRLASPEGLTRMQGLIPITNPMLLTASIDLSAMPLSVDMRMESFCAKPFFAC